MASRANPQNGGLARRPNPEVPAIEKKIDAVFLELNGIWLGFRDALHHFDFADVHFAAAGRARLGLNGAGGNHTRFLGQSFERAEGCGIFLLGDDSLDYSGAVAENREQQFAGFAQVVEPAADFYGAPDVFLRAARWKLSEWQLGLPGSFLVGRGQLWETPTPFSSRCFSSLSKTARIWSSVGAPGAVSFSSSTSGSGSGAPENATKVASQSMVPA